jgi:hypothetical protein
MPPPLSQFDREMHALEAEMKRLEAEYTMFFAGRLPRLPWERKARVEMLIKTHDRVETRNTADRFRFQTMQARFVKFLELWDRQLRDREESGRSKPKRSRAPAAPAEPAQAEPSAPPASPESTTEAPTDSRAASIPAAAAAASPPAPASEPRATRKRHAPTKPPTPDPAAERELHVMKLHATSSESDRVKELYERLAEAKRQVGETPLPFDRIAALVNAQLQKHSSSADDVAFRIAVKDGKVSLTVKPVKD